MSTEKKYVLKLNPQRRGDLSHHSKYLLVVEGEDGKGYEEPIDDVVGDLLRKVTDVEDRTRPDYSDVPVGTAGTATVNGVEGVRLIRKLDGWWLANYVEGTSHRHDDENAVTDFTPDVVVDEVLIGRVTDFVAAYSSVALADLVANRLRGES